MSGEICYPDTTDWSCLPTTVLEELDPAMKERAEALAWSTLAALTAYQIGTCPITVRPCLASCNPTGIDSAIAYGGHTNSLPVRQIGTFSPHIDSGGQWVNACGCKNSGECSCTQLCEAFLPLPVGAITSVRIDGAVLDPSAYRVDNGYRLVRTDGECWPKCQDMAGPGGPQYEPVVIVNPANRLTFTRVGQTVTILVEPTVPAINGAFLGALPWPVGASSQTPARTAAGGQVGMFTLTDKGPNVGGSASPGWVPFTVIYTTTAAAGPNDALGTFEVSYYRGAAPNVMTSYAAGVLAWEFYQACSGNECRLPSGVTAVTRQGVSFQIAQGMFTSGLTGIREVDAVISIYNPNGLTAPPSVSSPDRRPARMTTAR